MAWCKISSTRTKFGAGLQAWNQDKSTHGCSTSHGTFEILEFKGPSSTSLVSTYVYVRSTKPGQPTVATPHKQYVHEQHWMWYQLSQQVVGKTKCKHQRWDVFQSLSPPAGGQRLMNIVWDSRQLQNRTSEKHSSIYDSTSIHGKMLGWNSDQILGTGTSPPCTRSAFRKRSKAIVEGILRGRVRAGCLWRWLPAQNITDIETPKRYKGRCKRECLSGGTNKVSFSKGKGNTISSPDFLSEWWKTSVTACTLFISLFIVWEKSIRTTNYLTVMPWPKLLYGW